MALNCSQLETSIRALKEQMNTVALKGSLAARKKFAVIGGDNRKLRVDYWRRRYELICKIEAEKRQPTINRLIQKLTAQQELLNRLKGETTHA